jgi:acyl-lipid omega-6 desaturase (Delta-12 desaturase)
MDSRKQPNVEPKASIVSDLKKDAAVIYRHILIDLALVSTIIGLKGVLGGFWFSIYFGLLASVLMFRGFAVMHDASHRALHPNRIINDLLGVIYGGVCLLPFHQWRNSHMQHHLWSGNIEKDPVMGFLIVYPNLSLRVQKTLTFLWKAWIPVLGLIQTTVFWNLAIRQVKDKKDGFKNFISFLSPVLIWGAVAGFLGVGAIGLITAVIIYFLGLEIVNFPHHLQLNTLKGTEKLPFIEQSPTTRTCSYPRFFEKFVVLNFNYHTAHHMYPNVPWFHLRELNSRIQGLVEVNTDKNLHWNLRNRKEPLSRVFYYETNRDVKAA